MSESRFADGCAFINDQYVPIAEAAIPITDTGFTRSDVTYDVVAVWQGSFFRLKDHLDRFENSWTALGMRPPVSRTEMGRILHQCVALSGLKDAYVEMMVTRGVPPAGDRDPRNFRNRFYAFAIPYIWIASEPEQQNGIDAIIATTSERISPRSVDPKVKNFHWGDLTRGLFEALEAGAKTAVLLDNDGRVTEGPGFNVFAFLDGRLITPETGVLEGITRKTVIELATEQGIDCEVGGLTAEQLLGADEVFFTSTAGGVMPVRKVDDTIIGDGTPGPVTMSLRELYWQAHFDDRWTEKVVYERDDVNISRLAS